MTIVLLQNPDSPLAEKLQTQVNWSGVYYDEVHQLPLTPVVALWDSYGFSHDLIKGWSMAINDKSSVVALLHSSHELKQFHGVPSLKIALHAKNSIQLIRENLRLAFAVQRQQTELYRELETINRRMEDMGIIGQAKNRLMEKWGFDEERAHTWLQTQSRARGQKMSFVARQVLRGYYWSDTVKDGNFDYSKL